MSQQDDIKKTVWVTKDGNMLLLQEMDIGSNLTISNEAVFKPPIVVESWGEYLIEIGCECWENYEPAR